MNIYYIVGIAVYVASYLLFYNLYEKSGMEKFINGKTSRMISLYLIAILFGSVSYLIISSLNTTSEYKFLFDSLLCGPASALIVFILPVKRNAPKA